MNKLLPNPFKFGDPVEGEYYLPRPELTRTVSQFLENHIHVVLMDHGVLEKPPLS